MARTHKALRAREAAINRIAYERRMLNAMEDLLGQEFHNFAETARRFEVRESELIERWKRL